jgi:hypothetical protein
MSRSLFEASCRHHPEQQTVVPATRTPDENSQHNVA